MKKVALVTVTYNAERNLSFFLPSLVNNNDVLSGVYFVDNKSSDNTLEELRTFKKTNSIAKVELIPNEKNYGYSYAVNVGVEKALRDGFEYICVTNNDVIFNSGFFAQMLSDATENDIDELGVPASINEHDLGLGYILDRETNVPKKVPPTKRQDLENKISDNPLPHIDAAHGGTILFSRRFFETVGFYDAKLFFGGDELDFLYRIDVYNKTHTEKIKCAVSLRSFLKMDNLTKHNSGHKLIKAKGMLQGNARVNLKHKWKPTDSQLYKEQHNLIKGLAKASFFRYVALYLIAFRGLCIEIYRHYFGKSS